mgnify:CR=1 FL=1|jgi:precorrin-6A/cobalt-precorrin-6A reductase
MVKHILILGGTGEARELAHRISLEMDKKVMITTSLAGMRTKSPNLPGKVRNGGFGGIEGMKAYLSEKTVDLLIDATHPFSKIISNHATKACNSVNNGKISRLQLMRPLWRIPTSAKWIEVDDLNAAATYLQKKSKRVFLTTGIRGLDNFSGMKSLWFLVRLIDQPKNNLPLENFQIITGLPPFTLEVEQSIIDKNSIDTLVAKHAGGSATETKILAAAEAGIKIVLIRRPEPEKGHVVESVNKALAWIQERV